MPLSRMPILIQPPAQGNSSLSGLQFFEYRRRLFLAGQPIPEPSVTLPDTYTITLPLPDPVPPLPRADVPSSAIGRLESLLDEDGVQETNAAWRAGVQGVHAHLTGRRKLAKPMRLGLVVSASYSGLTAMLMTDQDSSSWCETVGVSLRLQLMSGWIKDGTWPVDPKTKRAMAPPDSPILSAGSETGDPVLGGAHVLQPKAEAHETTMQAKGLDVPHGLIGEDDLHVGTNVWRGAEQGLSKTS